MPLEMTFSFDAAPGILHVGFAADGGRMEHPEELEAFERALTKKCAQLGAKVHLFFDLSTLVVRNELAERFGEKKSALCEKYAASVWHYGGQLAERAMVRNAAVRQGARSNVFKTLDDALQAFRAGSAVSRSRGRA